MLIEALFVIVAALSIAFLFLYFTSGNAVYQGGNAVYSLSEENQVLSTKDLSWGASPCTLRFAIYVESAPKTLSKVDCLQPSNTTPVTFQPSCSDYSFKPCSCSASNCSRCTVKDSYLSKLLSVSDSLELWASGYVSENDKPYIPALLKIRTASDDTKTFMESISLPAIPLQKWTVITIVKEGRRFDVYYGATLVISSMTQYIPVPPGFGLGWIAGNPSWKGQIGFFNGVNYAASISDVDSDVKELVNTKGIPFYLDQLRIDFSVIPKCLFGACNALPQVKPMSPFTVLESNVS